MSVFAFAATGGAEIIVRLVQLDTASGFVDEGSTVGHVSDMRVLDERRVRPAGGAWSVGELTFCDRKAGDNAATPIAYHVVRRNTSGVDDSVLVRVVESDGAGPHDPFALAALVTPRISPFGSGSGVVNEVEFTIGSPMTPGTPAAITDPEFKIWYDPTEEQAYWQLVADLGGGLQWLGAMPVRGVRVGHGAPTLSADNPEGLFIDRDTGDVWAAWDSPPQWKKIGASTETHDDLVDAFGAPLGFIDTTI